MGDTLWGLAGKYYVTLEEDAGGRFAAGFAPSLLYWVLADFNDIVDPTVRLQAGQQLWIPSARTVLEEILAEKRRYAVED